MECSHTNCKRKAIYFEEDGKNGWCKECMEYQLGLTATPICKRCLKKIGA